MMITEKMFAIIIYTVIVAMPPPQFLRQHRRCCCRRTDDADEYTLHDDFGLHILRWQKLDDQNYDGGKQHPDALQCKMPFTWPEVVHVYLAEREIEHAENDVRHEPYQFWSHEVANRYQWLYS